MNVLPRPRRVNPPDRTDPLPAQGYRLTITGGQASIDAADDAGAFYARQTLRQLGDEPADVVIEDWPDRAVRGVMLDVSRDKVPTMATCFELVDLLSSLKFNHLELYMEHTYAYPGHEEVWSKASPFTAEEIVELDAYCADRFVELTPHQNCLGHMERWLQHDTYRPLAVRPEGWTDDRGRPRPPTTIDPRNPKSLELVRGLFDELVPRFRSGRVHAGLDEPWELAGDADGYLSFVRAVRELPALAGKQMLMWGDIVAQHPDRIAEVPEGVTVCEWGYEDWHPYEMRTAALRNAGLPFWVCPGTSSWNSLLGRTTNMLANIRAAAAVEDAGGLLVTDWGDNGHLQYLPVSYAGFAFAAAQAWCRDTNDVSRDDFADALTGTVFSTRDEAVAMLDLGDVHRLVGPQLPNQSILLVHLFYPSIALGHTPATEGLAIEDLDRVSAAIDALRPSVSDEVATGADLVAHMVDDARHRLRGDGTIASIPETTRHALADRLSELAARHREVWLQRNRPGGLDDSAGRLQRVIELYLDPT